MAPCIRTAGLFITWGKGDKNQEFLAWRREESDSH